MGLIGRLALGVSKPRQPVLGTELAGIVTAVGRDVRRFKVGDEVFAFPGIKLGCHAEFRILHERQRVFPKPDNLSFSEAASISFGGTTALHFIRKAALHAGEKILVIGASGAIGAAMVQIAKHIGAEVSAVTSAGNADLVKSLGAAKVIDYRQRISRTMARSMTSSPRRPEHIRSAVAETRCAKVAASWRLPRACLTCSP